MDQKPGGSPFEGQLEEPVKGRSRWAPQITLAKMMLILTVVTAAFAPLAYLARALRGSRQSHFIFILLCLAGPSLLLIIVSAIHWTLKWGKGK